MIKKQIVVNGLLLIPIFNEVTKGYMIRRVIFVHFPKNKLWYYACIIKYKHVYEYK